MTGLAQDLRYALRQMRKSPGFAVTSILILALGVCASVAIFGFVDSALIKPLPYPNPDQLMLVTESVAMIPRANLSYPDYLDWKRLNHVFSSMDVVAEAGYLLRTPSGAEPVPGIRVSDGFLRTLGVTLLLGRDFHSVEDLPSAPKTVMLTFSAWQKRYAGSKDVIGKNVSLSGVPFIIIGVLPQNFQFAPAGNIEFITTLNADDYCRLRRGCHNLTGFARLKDSVTVESALAEMKTIARQLELQYPTNNRGQGAFVAPLSQVILSDVRPVLLALLGGAGLLLLIACVNVSSLMLVRSESRKREVAVRGALGASRSRLIRQFTTEGVVLVAGGGLLGVMAAQGAMRILMGLISKDMAASMPYLAGLGLNRHVLGFAAVVLLGAAALFSITPIVRLSLSEMREGLTEGGRGYAGTLWRRLGANLVVVELAVAVVLLVSAGLLGKSLYRLLHVETGFQPEGLATMGVSLLAVASEKDAQQVPVAKRILDRIAALPGVEFADLTSDLPVSHNGNTIWIRIVGKPYNGEHNEVNQRKVSAAFFRTLRARLLRGRYFTDSEDASKPGVVVINRALAEKYFPGENPIGQRIGGIDLDPKSICEIVGVIGDVRDGSLDEEVWPAIYHPFNQDPDPYFNVVMRSPQPAQLLPAMVAAVHEIDPGIGTEGEFTMTGRINNSETADIHRSSAWLLAGFAALALLLGVVGLYGVIAYSVSQRTREIGVRMALGAQRGSIYQLIMKEALWLTLVGVTVGLLCAVAVASLMRSLLFHVQSWDAETLAAVALALGTSALAASYIPARRAAKVDPMVALRYE